MTARLRAVVAIYVWVVLIDTAAVVRLTDVATAIAFLIGALAGPLMLCMVAYLCYSRKEPQR